MGAKEPGMTLSRRSLLKGALAVGVGALILPPTLEENIATARRLWALDQTMLAPPAPWQLAGVERRWGRHRHLVMTGPMPAHLKTGDLVNIWARDPVTGGAYSALVEAIIGPSPGPPGSLPIWSVRLLPVTGSVSPRYQQDAISPYRLANLGTSRVHNGDAYGRAFRDLERSR
jgi:hypothetical protein